MSFMISINLIFYAIILKTREICFIYYTRKINENHFLHSQKVTNDVLEALCLRTTVLKYKVFVFYLFFNMYA